MTDPFVLAKKAVDDDQPVTERFDGKNRYLIPDPDNPDNTIAWTRATNLAKVLSETEALQRWAERMVAVGMSQRQDLLVQAQAIEDPTDYESRKTLDRISKAAKEAAGAWSRANQGTSLHSLTERVDLGDLDPADIEAPWGPLVRAYVAAMTSNRIRIRPEYIERTVVIKRFKVAGTFDRIVEMPNGQLWIADLKTGRTLDWSWGEIAIQLALYANADVIYDFEQEQFVPMPEVNQEQALIMHMPVEGTGCTLYRVNITHGWAAALLGEQVKNWRKNAKKLAEVLAQVPAEVVVVDWKARIDRTTSQEELGALWREAGDAWTDDLTEYGRQHLDKIAPA